MNEQLLAESHAMRTILRDRSRTREELQAYLGRMQELRKIYPCDEIFNTAEFVATELEAK